MHPLAQNFDECLSTMMFASNCRNISNRPVVNYLDLEGEGEDPRIAQLMAQVNALSSLPYMDIMDD